MEKDKKEGSKGEERKGGQGNANEGAKMQGREEIMGGTLRVTLSSKFFGNKMIEIPYKCC